MPGERMVKKVYKWKPMLRRPLGRPKNGWEDDIRNDMEKLKIKNWTNCIRDRKNWKLYVENAKTFKELKLERLEKRRRITSGCTLFLHLLSEEIVHRKFRTLLLPFNFRFVSKWVYPRNTENIC
jgi:hypothetical protein